MDFVKDPLWQIGFGVALVLMFLMALRNAYRDRIRGTPAFRSSALLCLIALIAWIVTHMAIIIRVGWLGGVVSFVCSFLIATVVAHLLTALSLGRSEEAGRLARHERKTARALASGDREAFWDVMRSGGEHRELLDEFLKSAADDPKVRDVMARYALTQEDLEDIHRRAASAGLDPDQACAAVMDPTVLVWYGENAPSDRHFDTGLYMQFALLLKERA